MLTDKQDYDEIYQKYKNLVMKAAYKYSGNYDIAEDITQSTFLQLYMYIEQLPSEQKKVILMSIEGYSWDEIAEKLGISVNTVKTHKSRGFKSLRSKLQDSVCLFLI